jgi:L-amino acid N-acyltransferase YncA
MLDSTIYPEIDLKTYQKTTQLKDGTKVLLRPMVAEDKDALYEFFKAVPREDARYLRDEVSSVLLIERWASELDYTKTLPILAVRDGKIIADATINRRPSGWKRHLGTVRIFVHEAYRNVGLGHLMIEELVTIAFRLGIEKLLVEIPDHDTPAIHAFTRAGFDRVALIPNMVKDRENMPVDIAVMIKDVKPAHDEAYDYDF